jgi:hypothetical protein
MTRGKSSVPVMVFNSDGRKILQLPDEYPVKDAEAGDLNGDGKKEIVVGYGGSGGLAAYDLSGEEVWAREAGECGAVAIADVNGDGVNEVLNSDGYGYMVMSDNQGRELSFDTKYKFFSRFRMTNWHDTFKRDKIISIMAEGLAYVSDSKLKTLAKLSIFGYAGSVYFRGRAFSFHNNPYYAAVLSNFNGPAVFFVFDGEGNTVYEECFAESGGGLYIGPKGILVGLNNRVVKYSLVQQKK